MGDLQTLVDNFQLPDTIGFGRLMAPVMFRAEYCDGIWSAGQLVPYGPISLDPAAKVLHYAQEVFEGMKAYWVDSETPQLFRPVENCKRFNNSAEFMCMPQVPEELFMSGVTQLTDICRNLIPRNSGASMYLRPFMFGTQADLTITASSSYEFYVIASPAEIYHAGEMRVIVERHRSRTAAGGMGVAKTGGNYAASMQSSKECMQQGYNQVLWLNSAVAGQIDELSGMNLFVVMDDELHTPELNGSILPGITRSAILELAKDLGYKVRERNIQIDSLLALIESGTCTEAFACGTAAVISPISIIADQGKEYPLPKVPGPVGQALYESLLAIQEGRVEDKYGWIQAVERQVQV
ncbi:branched-chain amino acid aminotransferase [Pseudomaricurvus alkylphenolicus]|jgi:branched-chain amino acid aminotransferase|uniref:branched-chain amino acid aminotransferase n=1 Tax=Pseudomaricurvus alkylphenolicus TaxID=1306991 RepID=UPI001422EB7E|nr:branched-chain amino acid aminotransferase [Pseudomaricurvus alkylphenolicus]NIB43613.1 branched-chain amino acid aminotransferase [Pseudomaricurvus alkylphenolicus]